VDDERSITSTIEAAMRSAGHQVEVADSGEMALTLMRKQVPDILLTDLRMDGMSGIDLLGKTKEYFPSVTGVIMTAFGTIDTAVSAMKQGAYDYLVKPFTPEQLEHLVERIEEFRKLREENVKLRDTVDALSEPSAIVSNNARMHKVLDTAKKVAITDSTVLITGESGTGKTLLAKVIHDASVRAKGPFAVVNCATLSENLLESELFGHVRGSFTGAVKDLQDREFEKVGDTKTIRVDVRIVAATNKDLEREVREGRFREDLYFRLNVIDLHMPSLRQRPEDIITLAEQLLTKSFVASNRPARPLSENAKKAILAYGWPGNIRELKNALERAAILCTTDFVTVEDLPDRVLEHSGHLFPGQMAGPGDAMTASDGSPTAMTPSDVSLEDLEKQHIRHILTTATTLEEAASILGINLSTLWRKRRRYGLE
jgi:NtrC-family two-component system response regulator AlgB